MPSRALPGLDRLLEVGRKHGFPLKTLPAGHRPPQAGEVLAGHPVDPLLAAALARLGGLVIGFDHHILMRCDDEVNAILAGNEEWQSHFPHRFWPDHFQSLMIFGVNMLYRYATVPALANPEGLQPVVFVDPYEDIHALPIASDVNRFFETCSHYVELMAGDPEYEATGTPAIGLPWGTPELIARDGPLIEMLRAGRFDHLMYARDKMGKRGEGSIADIQKWRDAVLSAS